MVLDALIRSIPEETIVDIVKSCGTDEHSRTHDHIVFTTVCHGGDSPKLYYYRQSKTFYCFSHCGYMSLYDFLMNAKGLTFNQAVDYLRSFVRSGLRIGNHGDSQETTRRLRELERSVKLRRYRHRQPFELTSIDDSVLECFENDVFYDGWLNEGISADTMKQFGIRWDELNKAIVIPHYDMDGALVGIRVRKTDATAGKYLPLQIEEHTYSHPLGMNLYGCHIHKEAIARSRQAVIFEGEKSVMKHHTWYGSRSNAVAVCGFHVSDEQRELLLKLGIEEVVLGFDKDVSMEVDEDTITPEYEKYCERVDTIGRQFAPYCRVTALVDYGTALDLKDAPVDKGKEVFEDLMRNRVTIRV